MLQAHDRRVPRSGRAAAVALAMMAMALVAGCLPRVRREQPLDLTTVFTCGGDYRFSVRELGDVATVRADVQTIALPRTRAASGRRYAREATEFWNRGTTGTLTLGGAKHADCMGQVVTNPWDEARLLGVDYRAAGNEPTWSLEIDEGKYMRFMVAGGSPVYSPVPQAVTDSTRRILRGDGESGIEVAIVASPCRNATSPEPFPHTVTVTFNGFPYPGCGGPLTPS
jgi:membrane-bound inhibitor of C-type lysozyme